MNNNKTMNAKQLAFCIDALLTAYHILVKNGRGESPCAIQLFEEAKALHKQLETMTANM
jgi:hypothetical protein